MKIEHVCGFCSQCVPDMAFIWREVGKRAVLFTYDMALHHRLAGVTGAWRTFEDRAAYLARR